MIVLMAVAGSATTAYQCRLVGGMLFLGNTQMMSKSVCETVHNAIPLLQAGRMVIVAGSNIVELRKLLRE